MGGQVATPCSNDNSRMGSKKLALIQVPIDSLRPTQMAVGMRSVKHKRRRLESGGRKRVEKLVSGRPIPAVRGPDGNLFIIDHHHFGLALWHAEIKRAFAIVIDDKSGLSQAEFWRHMEAEGRLYPFDEEGRRIKPSGLPTGLHELRHDPFRDLAWEVREAGGFRKSKVPYAEFQWAGFFRDRISLAAVRRDHDDAVVKALKLCRGRAASHLPGYLGSHTPKLNG